MEDLARFWSLDPEITFLNHGSFGACPVPVLEEQESLRRRLESEPVRFFMREGEGLADAARNTLGKFLGCTGDDLAFVINATQGVNTVLRSLDFGPGDELLVTDHEYNACRNALNFVAEKTGATVVVAELPFPLQSPGEITAAILARATEKTRIALVDHITSQTGLVFPIQDIVNGLKEKGIDTLVDGAHGPGMVDLDLQKLDPAYYTGNCHKWMCTPKGSAVLYVRRDLQPKIRPLSISHGANSLRTDRSRFRLEFDWTGTDDPTPWLAIPKAIEFLGGLYPGGWPELRAANRNLALRGREILCATLGLETPAPEEMIGTLASLPLPPGKMQSGPDPMIFDPIQDDLWERHQIEVMVIPWPTTPQRLLRISAQAYNTEEDYRKLTGAVKELLAEGR